jgi:putative spermidine/putrescine transport system permease protein
MSAKFSFVTFVNILIYIFILAPLLVVIISSFNPAEYLVFPPKGFTFDWYIEVLSEGEYTQPFWNSLSLALATTAIALPVGTMIAYAIQRYDFKFKNALQSFFLSPLVIPTLLLGIGLLILYSNLGVDMVFTRLLLAHVVIVIPYVVRTMIAGFSGMDKSIEQAAIILGASPVKTFFLVTLPLARPALLGSAFLSLVVSFDELIIALFLTGPGFNTLPMKIYSDVQFNLSTSLAAISSLIIIGTILIGLIAVFFMRITKK